jgi:hypothetical protein
MEAVFVIRVRGSCSLNETITYHEYEFLFRFLSVQPQRLRRRPVIDRKQDRVLAARVFVRMPLPRRHDEDIALVPIEFVG